MNLSDEIILNEIRESLALSQRLRARSKKDGAEKVQSSPYDVKHAAGTIPNAKKPVKDSKLDENKSGTMQRRLKSRVKGNNESLQRLFTEASVIDRKSGRESDLIVKMKTINQPYLESMVTINQTIELHNSGFARTQSVSSLNKLAAARFAVAATSVAASTDRMRKKYPRFCSTFNFDDNLLHGVDEEQGRYVVNPRSDVWLGRFMEDCYDVAYSACYCSISSERWRLKNGLDLGALDAFPFLVQRFIDERFSKMEVRDRLCVELLLTLELQMEKSNRIRVILSEQEIAELIRKNDLDSNSQEVFNADRALLFSRFLSEDYDIDCLAAFLHARHALQSSVLKNKFRYYIQDRIWRGRLDEVGTETLSRSKSQSNAFGISRKDRKSTNPSKVLFTRTAEDLTKPSPSSEVKVVPVKLPTMWYHVGDVAMPECPLIGFDEAILSFIVTLLLQSINVRVRKYFIEELLYFCQKSIVKVKTNPLFSTNVKLKNDSTSQNIGRIIPVASLLSFLCREWNRVPLDSKLKELSNVSRASDSLRTLRAIYDKDCEMAKAADAAVMTLQVQLTEAQAKEHQLDKDLRKVERKWTGGVATPAELERIQDLRNTLSQAKLARCELEADLKNAIKERLNLKERIDELWKQATFLEASSTTSEKPSRVNLQSIERGSDRLHIPVSDWRMDVTALLVKVFVLNEEHDRFANSGTKALGPVAGDDETKGISDPEPAQRDGEDGSALIEQYRLTVVETLSKIVVRNAVNEGIKRELLRQYLAVQSKKLRFQYGGNEYRIAVMEAEQRAEDEKKRKLRVAAVAVAAKQMAAIVVRSAVTVGLMMAAEYHYDPWAPLEWPLERWLDAERIVYVTKKQQAAQQSHLLWQKKVVFNSLLAFLRLKRLTVAVKRRIQRAVISQLRLDVFKEKHQILFLRKIQNCSRSFLFRLRFAKTMLAQSDLLDKATQHNRLHLSAKKLPRYLMFWTKWTVLRRKLANCRFNLKERRFMVTFFTWLHLFKVNRTNRIASDKVKMVAILRLQCWFRCCIAKKNVRKLRSFRKIALAAKAYVTRKRFKTMLDFARRLQDYSSLYLSRRAHHRQQRSFIIWRRSFKKVIAFNKIANAVRLDKIRRRWKKWAGYSRWKTRRLGVPATKIQKIVRMSIVKHTILHYYKFKRGLLSLQGLCRRRHCMRIFAYEIYYYRAARSIQRVMRGYLTRNHLFESRVKDIHYAASHNNHPKLLFYTQKYPELLNELDEDGNTALHNAAKTASKRTVKLLLKVGLNPNALNLSGLTPLHMVIMSPVAGRDDCALYMLDGCGFDEDARTPDGKTCLLLAAEYCRPVILRQLLTDGHDSQQPDFFGMTPLQAACRIGNIAMVTELLKHGADVNGTGRDGYTPLHDSVLGGNLDVPLLLLRYGAYLNQQTRMSDMNTATLTPLMLSCQLGKADFARLFILQGADPNARDSKGRNAAHYGVYANQQADTMSTARTDVADGSISARMNTARTERDPNKDYSEDIYNALREAEVDFDCLDDEGNSPLHLAAEAGSTALRYAMHLLLGGAFPSFQNNSGNQPAHLAAQNNQVELLKQICIYDEHIGRVNYKHQTPLGVAKFYRSKACQIFLQTHYKHVDVSGQRNAVGDIWWDKPIDELAGDWEVKVNHRSERLFFNRRTGEVTKKPPAVPLSLVSNAAKTVMVPMRRKVVLVKESGVSEGMNKNAYYKEYDAAKTDVALHLKYFNAAATIQKFARRKLVYLAAKRLRLQKTKAKILKQFFFVCAPKFKRWKDGVKFRAASKIQSIARLYLFRKDFFSPAADGGPSRFSVLREAYAKRKVRKLLWAAWLRLKTRRAKRVLRMRKNMPTTLADWQVVIDRAGKPLRVVGIFQEYLFPGTKDVFFYRHASTGACYFDKPAKLKMLDEQAFREQRQIFLYGATLRQIALITKLQALVRGHQVRSYGRYVERAMEISLNAEKRYLENPLKDTNLFNYCLYCYVVRQDFDRARHLFVESFERMAFKGPDIPFVLYSYAIFAFVSHDLDYDDIMALLYRARIAEQQKETALREKQRRLAPLGAKKKETDNSGQMETKLGKSFEFANTGFFRYSATTLRNERAWHCFAACRFLVFDDFKGSFDAFLEAFRWGPKSKPLKANFDIMMTHFHGPDKNVQNSVVQERMRRLAEEDAERQETRRLLQIAAYNRHAAAARIQKLWRRFSGQRKFDRTHRELKSRLAERIASARSRRSMPPSRGEQQQPQPSQRSSSRGSTIGIGGKSSRVLAERKISEDREVYNRREIRRNSSFKS